MGWVYGVFCIVFVYEDCRFYFSGFVRSRDSRKGLGYLWLRYESG